MSGSRDPQRGRRGSALLLYTVLLPVIILPIIGLATYGNPTKHSENKNEFVVFHADFDPKDRYRYHNGKKNSLDVNGDIAGLINEALETMMKVEDMEIARAEAAEAEAESAARLAA